jgi:hypothetical protein
MDMADVSRLKVAVLATNGVEQAKADVVVHSKGAA